LFSRLLACGQRLAEPYEVCFCPCVCPDDSALQCANLLALRYWYLLSIYILAISPRNGMGKRAKNDTVFCPAVKAPLVVYMGNHQRKIYRMDNE
jgi:hypothetical protein